MTLQETIQAAFKTIKVRAHKSNPNLVALKVDKNDAAIERLEMVCTLLNVEILERVIGGRYAIATVHKATLECSLENAGVTVAEETLLEGKARRAKAEATKATTYNVGDEHVTVTSPLAMVPFYAANPFVSGVN